MKIPFRPFSFIKPKRPYRYIILHDLSCQFNDLPELAIDTKKFESGKVRLLDYVFNNHTDVNYHYMVEKVGDDYETIVGRPLNALCKFSDIVSPFDASIHICLVGFYKQQVPDSRYYKQLAYRAVAPLMSVFKINRSRVLLHKDISEKSNCPGNLFKRDVFMNVLQTMSVQY